MVKYSQYTGQTSVSSLAASPYLHTVIPPVAVYCPGTHAVQAVELSACWNLPDNSNNRHSHSRARAATRTGSAIYARGRLGTAPLPGGARSTNSHLCCRSEFSRSTAHTARLADCCTKLAGLTVNAARSSALHNLGLNVHVFYFLLIPLNPRNARLNTLEVEL